MATIEGKIGEVLGATGGSGTFSQDGFGGLVTGAGHGVYTQAARQNRMYCASNQSSTALTALAATNTGFALHNPAGSTIDVAVLEVAFLQTSVAAAEANQSIALAATFSPEAGAVTHTTPLTIRNCYIGSASAGSALADGACTLNATPVVIRAFWQPTVSATATTGIPPLLVYKPEGSIVLKPGTSLAIVNLADASAAVSIVGSMVWIEIPTSNG